ncbi:cytochrome P450 94C1-like [Cicer arietinum]|uniref:Cytochrome P450 94C1-like n=1 Tax=Cicer arietinum TaxID=3827 RepID=A0A1S2XFI5_CICAR|nr:cytochrome P450 94C1-like [Cicer arietinum]
MNFETSQWFQNSIPITIFTFLFFTFTLLFSFFSFLIFIFRMKPWCSCNICWSYLTMSWANEFINISDWYTHLLKKSPTGTIHIHVLNNTITCNPKNIEHILKTRFDNYPKGKPFSAILGDLLGNGIFNVDGVSWNFQRKMASLELTSVTVRSHALQIITEEIHTRLIPFMISSARAEKVIDLQDIMRRFSFDNICKFSFGWDPLCLQPNLPVSELAENFDIASKLSAMRAMSVLPLTWKIKRFLNVGSEKKLKEAILVVNNLTEKIINKCREIGFSTRNDLLSRFMCSVNDDKYLRDIVISFLLAGRDTVAAGLTCLFWLLKRNQRVEKIILEEVNRVMNPVQEYPNFEQIREMNYLNAVVYETMRLYPPVQFDSKFAKEDDVLPDGSYVKKGSRVTYHPYAMGRMERVWGSDCCEFKPERWLKDGVFVNESVFKYPVFQGGVRVCLGKELALMEMKCVIVALVRRFEVRVEGNGEIQFVPGLTTTLRDGLPVRVFEK